MFVVFCVVGALSAIGIAIWDALAVSLGRPFAVVLGGAPRSIPARDLGSAARRRWGPAAGAMWFVNGRFWA